jgi:hypothetical protein
MTGTDGLGAWDLGRIMSIGCVAAVELKVYSRTRATPNWSCVHGGTSICRLGIEPPVKAEACRVDIGLVSTRRPLRAQSRESLDQPSPIHFNCVIQRTETEKRSFLTPSAKYEPLMVKDARKPEHLTGKSPLAYNCAWQMCLKHWLPPQGGR